jgi:hypothetical protein
MYLGILPTYGQIFSCLALISCFLIHNFHSGGWSPNWVHSARRPFILGLLYLPQVIVRLENLVE